MRTPNYAASYTGWFTEITTWFTEITIDNKRIYCLQFGQKTYGKPLSQMPGETLVSNLEKKGLEKGPNKISRTEHCFNNW